MKNIPSVTDLHVIELCENVSLVNIMSTIMGP